LWRLDGITEAVTDSGLLYLKTIYFLATNTQQVEIYGDVTYSNLLAVGQVSSLVATSITIQENDGSGISGTVDWDATPLDFTYSGILYCIDKSSSSSSSSIDSSSESSESQQSESSSSSQCCASVFCEGPNCSYFSSWSFSGMGDGNSTNCTMYVGLLTQGSVQQIRVYKEPGRATLTAVGQRTGAGSITLIEQNNSGLSGSVTWDGTLLSYPNTLVLSCNEFSSSSSSSSSSIDSSSSSSDEYSESTISYSSSSSSSSVDSSSSSSSDDYSSSSSSSVSISSSSSPTSESSSSSSSIDSSSTSSESIGNFSSSSSSSEEFWNQSKPLLLGLSSAANPSVKNRLAQTFKVLTSTYDIGKVYLYLYKARGFSTNYYVRASIYDCNDDGTPKTELHTQSIHASTIIKDDWYAFSFDLSGQTTPTNGYLAISLRHNGDEDNFVLWGYDKQNSESDVFAWTSNNTTDWVELKDSSFSLRIVETFQAFNADNNTITTPASTGTTTKNDSVSDSEIDYPDTILSFVVDSSGTMGDSDRFNNRKDIVTKLTNKFIDNYPSNAKFDIFTFGGSTSDLTSSSSNIGFYSTINLDLNVPDRTTYTFSVSNASADKGAIYENDDNEFEVLYNLTTSQTTLVTYGSAAPIQSGTLNLVSGTGDATIDYTEFSEVTISDPMIAYGFKSLENGHTYNIGDFQVDFETVNSVNLNNWQLFQPNTESATISLGSNSPTSGDTIDIIASKNVISRKMFTNAPITETQLDGPLFVGDSVIRAADASGFSVGDTIDIIQGDLANVGREITEIDGNEITFTPSATLGIKDYDVAGSIIQTSLYNKSTVINGTTANILVRDEKKSRQIIFYLQNINGYYLEWDFDAFSEWTNNNVFFFGETAVLPMTFFDSDGVAFPDGTRIELTVDKKPDIYTVNETESANVTQKSFTGETKIYVDSTTGYSRESIIDIIDKNGNIQTTEITEVDEDGTGPYIEIADPLLFDVSADLGTTIRLNVTSNEVLTLGNNILSAEIPVVDVTPIVNDKDLDSSLLLSYDIDRVPPSTPYEDLNTAQEFFQKKVIDMPTVDGNACARILPIVEDILETIKEKEEDLSRTQTYTIETDTVSQLEQNEGDVEESNQVTSTTTAETDENKDYVIESPVFTVNGEATSSMQSFSTEYSGKDFSNIIVPGVDNPVFFSKDYEIFSFADFLSREGNTSARLYLEPFNISFITPVNINSTYSEGDEVQYYLSDPEGEGCVPSYANQLIRGHYASDEKEITLNYVVSDQFVLANNKNINVVLYSNRVIDLESAASSVKFGTTKAKVSEQFANIRPLNETSDTVNTVIDQWRDIVKNNPFEDVIDSANQIDSNFSNEDTERENIRDTILNQYGSTLGGEITGAVSSDPSLFYSDPINWTLAKQYDTYEFTIPIVNGRGTLKIPTNDKVHLLFVEASVDFGDNNQHEQILADAFFVANPITIKGLSPESISPVENDLYEIGVGLEYLDGSTTIADNVQVDFNFSQENSTFKVEPSSSVTNSGWAGGVFIGPLEIIEPEISGESDTICPPKKTISATVEVFHPSGYSRKATRTIDISYDNFSTDNDTFLFYAEDATQSLYSDGSINSNAKVKIDLDDAFNPTEQYVGADGIARLKGLDQPDGARILTAFNSLPKKTAWESNVIELTAVSKNKNIGFSRPLTTTETFKEPWSSQINAYTSYRTSNGIFRKGEIASGLPSIIKGSLVTPKPVQKYVEPLGITVNFETSFTRDGATSSTIYADLTWKGEPIKDTVALNAGTELESTITYPFPKVQFESGISQEENINIGAINTAKDDRNSIEGCLIVGPHPDMILSDYSVQSGLFRSDIHNEVDGSGNIVSSHTHSTSIDSSGNGLTTSTIVLSGTVTNHTHTFSNYSSNEVLGHDHELRCVALTTINPTNNINTDFVVNGTVIYDPTNAEPYREEPVNPEGNRKMFSTLRVPAGSETAKRLVSRVELGNDLDNGDPTFILDYESDVSTCEADTSATFYTASSIDETIKGFDIRVFVKFPEYSYIDNSGNTVIVPEEVVPDGSRVTVELIPYKPESDGGTTDPGFLVMGAGVKRDYINLRVNVSVSYDGFLSERKFVIAVASTQQWYPSIKQQVSGLTNDPIHISSAVENFGFFGSSQIHDAVKKAAQSLAQYQLEDSGLSSYEKNIILITDGDENSSENSVNQALESVNFVDGIGNVNIVPIQIGHPHPSDLVLLEKYANNSSSKIYNLNNSTDGQMDDICDSIVKDLPLSYYKIEGEVSFDSSNIVNTVSIPNYTLESGSEITYRSRISTDGTNFSNWTKTKDVSETISYEKSLTSLQSKTQYEINLYGNEDFQSPSVDNGVNINYFIPKEFIVFFQPISVDLTNDEYISSIHLTHESDIPDTSTIQFFMTQSDSLRIEEYIKVLPDQHTVIPTRFNEILLTDDNKVFTAINGGWSSNLSTEIYRLDEGSTQGVLVQPSTYSQNNQDGKITFLSAQDPASTLFINVFFDSSFRIAAKTINYSSDQAVIHHIGIMYNISKRIPRLNNGTIQHVPISKRLTE
jgi:Mg-chelatase subunit ChlD